MSMHDLDKAYVSPYDLMMYTFDATHEKSASQLKEIQKHQRIATMRDKPHLDGDEEVIWKEF